MSFRLCEYLYQIKQKVAVLSLDSLAIYCEIDIASAKPESSFINSVPHFALNVLYPNQPCSFANFSHALQDALEHCQQSHSHLLIVGGSSFYLKAMLDGISPAPPPLSDSQKTQLQHLMHNTTDAYSLLQQIDCGYAQKIHDRYRLQKALEIYLATSLPPSVYFANNPKKPQIDKIPVFEIDIEQSTLWNNIENRTESMLQKGLLDEVRSVINRYGKEIQPAKSIGFKECLAYLDNQLSYKELKEQIIIHTRQFAKRQKTFNKTQLQTHRLDSDTIFKQIIQICRNTS